MAPQRAPRSIQQLKEQAEIKDNPNKHPVKTWAKAAINLFEKGQEEFQSGDLEEAFVHLMRGSSIALELIPRHKEYSLRDRDDAVYAAARRKATQYLTILDEIKVSLQARTSASTGASSTSLPLPPPSTSSSSHPSPQPAPARKGSSSTLLGVGGNAVKEARTVIQGSELLGILKAGTKSVLVLDVRKVEDFIHGHLKWKLGPGIQGGVVNIEPSWLESPTVSAADIEMYLFSFGQSSKTAKQLFDMRNQFDFIFFLDDHSTTADATPTLRTLMKVLYESHAKTPKLRPLLLSGGQVAWEKNLSDSNEMWIDWVEIGDGNGRHVGGLGQENALDPGDHTGIARSAYDYVALRTQVPGHIQMPPPAVQSHQIRSPDSSQSHNPFYNITNIPSALPVSVQSQQPHYYQAPSYVNNFSQPTSRFNDPFFSTENTNKRNGMIGPYLTQSNGRSALGAYPQLSQNVSTAQAPSSFQNMPTYGSPPPLPNKPSSGYLNQNFNPVLANNTAPSIPYKSTSPLLARRPPLEVAIAPPAVIRRSSSPSASPNTARFYSVPPPLPNKPPLRQNSAALSGPIAHIQGGGGSGEWAGSFMGMAGIKNLVARYFMTGAYRKHINRKNPLGTKGEVAEAFADLVKTMWNGQDSNVITPTKFKQVIGAHHPSFRGSEQQDSQEFLGFLLDSLHEDMNVARLDNVPPDTGKDAEDDDDGVPDEMILDRTWRRYRRRNWSIIVDLFQGILKSRLQCMTCGKTSTTFDTFMYLTLPIPTHNHQGKKGGPVYIQECLDKFVEEEILDGNDAWRCPRCKVPRRTTKRLTIARLPVILLVHLKRFYFSGPFRDRVDTYVEFPLLNLDLTNYLGAPREPFVYDLYGVSNHFGGLNGGHYTAQVRNSYKANQWFNFDDSRISPTDARSVQTPAAYILFYIRQVGPGQARTKDDWWAGSGSARM
ncbi:ubiquitin-specific protease doa4 [Thoreauomyces humboldtii]|nr:ubiquitin-specific protease doa4 [Thoreauomyces humboldtii]